MHLLFPKASKQPHGRQLSYTSVIAESQEIQSTFCQTSKGSGSTHWSNEKRGIMYSNCGSNLYGNDEFYPMLAGPH